MKSSLVVSAMLGVTVPSIACSQHTTTERTDTHVKIADVKASSNQRNTGAIIDGNIRTYWASAPGEREPTNTFTLDRVGLLESMQVMVNREFGVYRVDVSLDGAKWSTAIASHKPQSTGIELLRLPARTVGKFVRIQYLTASPKTRVLVFHVAIIGKATDTPDPAPTQAPTPSPQPTTTPAPQPTATITPIPEP